MSTYQNKHEQHSKEPEQSSESPTEQDLDLQIIERVQQGDKRAFNLLVRKYQNRIGYMISRNISNQGDVDDIVQEVFIKAYRALASFRRESAFYTWLYRIAINTMKNYITASGRKPSFSDIDTVDTSTSDHNDILKEKGTPENLLLTDELRQLVFDTIEQLPQELNRAITLRELEGLSYEEIAQAVECPVGTVRSRIFRAREIIDQAIRPLLAK